MQNRVFFPQAALDEWLVAGAIELNGSVLTISSEKRRYIVAEGVRVLREVTGQPDASELVGKVKSLRYIEELGAEVLEGSMLLGDNAYDIVAGWVGLLERAPEPFGSAPGSQTMTDEAALARFVREQG